MARELALLGVPAGAIVRERCSFSTRENAHYTAALLARRGIDRVVLVTCAWHLPRAVSVFSRAGLTVEAVPAPDAGGEGCAAGSVRLWPRRLLRWGVERMLGRAWGPSRAP